MSNPSKTRGDRFENAVRDYVQGNGFPWTERTRAGYARDWGDLHLEPITRAVIAQCKNHNRLTFPEWLVQLRQQVQRAGARHGVLVVKRRGVSDPGRSLAVMELEQFLVLLREAGYGDQPEETS